MSVPVATVVSVCACVSVTTKEKKELEIYWGDRGASPPMESGVFSAFQPLVLKRRETHSGNGDNSAVIAGDLEWTRARRSNISGEG